MEFEKKEIEIIKNALEERGRVLLKYLKEWDITTWENLGSMQEMYANKQAFEQHKENIMNIWNEEYEQIDKMLERIYEEI